MSDAKRVGIQLPLGFSSGLPRLLTTGTLSAWLYDEGIDIKAIGAFALVALPYNFKFLWAPVLDRFGVPFLGRRRGWILLAQLLLALALVVMGTADAGARPDSIALIAVAVAFLSASQDVVVDAYRTDVLADDERGKGTAAYVTGYRIALIVAGAGALIAADYVGWRATYFILAGLMAACVVGTVVAPEPAEVHAPRNLGQAVVRPLIEYFTRRGAILALAAVALYKFGDAMAGHMVTPFLLDVGFDKTDIGLVKKFGGMGATIVGAFIGGWMADRMGVMRTMIWFGVVQALANVGYIVVAETESTMLTLIPAVLIDDLCNGMGTAAFVAFIMSLCNARFSATQYALLTSASSILGRTFGASSGLIQAEVGWSGFFAITVVVAAPALVVLLCYRWWVRPASDEQ